MSVHYLYKKTTGRTSLVPIDTETIATILDKLRLTGGSYTLTIQAPSLAGNLTITLPNADGTAGQVLQTNGSNVWSWTDKAGAASAVTEAFKTIACPAGTNPVADAATDTLTLAAGSARVTITGASASDTVTFDIVNAQIDHDALLNFAANEHIDWTNAATALVTSLNITGRQLTSTVADGTAPLVVTSTTAVANLNADTVDARHASYFATAGHTHLDLVSGNVPIGSIFPWAGGYFGDGSNGSYTRVLGDANTVAGANVYLNPLGFWICDGSALNDAASPIWVGAGRYLPNLTDSRFLMGSTTAGGIGGSNTMAHTHTAGAITVDAEAAHVHGVGSLVNAAEAAHVHAAGSIVTASDGVHAHDTTSRATGTESANHTHTVGGTTGAGSAHKHTVQAQSQSTWLNTTEESTHTHSFSDTSAGVSATHTHSIAIPDKDSAGHTHAMSGNSGAGASHNHAISGSTAAVSHTHTASGAATGAASNAACLPVYLAVFWVIRVK